MSKNPSKCFLMYKKILITMLSFSFEIYNGAGDNKLLPGIADLGACSNVVVRLSQSIPDMQNYIVYFDNFYTSVGLMVYLRSRGIFALGTVRANRLPKCKLPTDSDLKDEERGYSVEYGATVQGVKISAVVWKDNKVVRLASTYVGIRPFETVNDNEQRAKAARYDRKEKAYVEIDCPQIIREYNAHMGGVDLMDGLVGRYKVRTKSKDIMRRLFYHLLDMAVVNAYILHKRIFEERRNSSDVPAKGEKTYELPIFRRVLAESLLNSGNKRARGRPPTPASGRTTPIVTAVGRNSPVSLVGKRAHHLPPELRYDGIDHKVEFGKKMWCKQCSKSQTNYRCSKCQLNLCIPNGKKDCFNLYHTK